jgi:hypothetical protein
VINLTVSVSKRRRKVSREYLDEWMYHRDQLCRTRPSRHRPYRVLRVEYGVATRGTGRIVKRFPADVIVRAYLRQPCESSSCRSCP